MKVAFNAQQNLTRDFILKVMHVRNNDSFKFHNPSSKRIFRVEKVLIGIHDQWAGDGHDKLYKISFPVWAVVDDAMAKWLGAWIVPSNRMGHIIGFLYLCVVTFFGGEFVLFLLMMDHDGWYHRNSIAVHNRLWLRDDTTLRAGECITVCHLCYLQ